jgi:lambda repressor-like predicted transcriptional regulator
MWRQVHTPCGVWPGTSAPTSSPYSGRPPSKLRRPRSPQRSRNGNSSVRCIPCRPPRCACSLLICRRGWQDIAHAPKPRWHEARFLITEKATLPPDTLADWLKDRLRERGLSQRQLAVQTGIASGTISTVLHGHIPRPSAIVTLAGVFGADAGTVLELSAPSHCRSVPCASCSAMHGCPGRATPSGAGERLRDAPVARLYSSDPCLMRRCSLQLSRRGRE